MVPSPTRILWLTKGRELYTILVVLWPLALYQWKLNRLDVYKRQGFAVGDAVKVKDGAEYFATGEHMASFVRKGTLYVIQEGDGKMLVSTAPGGAATGWIRTEDLVKA